MSFDLKHPSLTVRAGLLGCLSGIFSCLLASSSIIYIARAQKTFDHIVWPGLVFAVVVIFPLSRWAGYSRLRMLVAVIASSVVYPFTWRIATLSTSRLSASWEVLTAEFALAGLLGSLVLAVVALFGRAGWARAAAATAVLGAVVGGLMGANLAAAATAHWPILPRDGLGLFLVLWQAVVGASLGHGIQATRRRAAEATNR